MKDENPYEKSRISRMHKNANYRVFRNAYRLRGNTTPAEKMPWDALKGKKLGVRFRRQHAVSRFVVDFYCHYTSLVIELDGGYHDEPQQQLADQARTETLEDSGLKIIRFRNEEVLENLEKVLEVIRGYL